MSYKTTLLGLKCVLKRITASYSHHYWNRMATASPKPFYSSNGVILGCYPYLDLGVQQCFGVVYHDLTTLTRVYFARAALDTYTLKWKCE